MNQGAINGYIINFPPLGTGLYATVYKAYDIENARVVAVKTTSNIKIAHREVEVMKGYGNYKYLPFFFYEDAAYIVMEYIRGKRLGKDFSNGSVTKYKEKYSLSVVLKILAALQRLHDSGYVHMDTKPSNVIATDSDPEQIKLIDFNTSRLVTSKNIQIDLHNAAKMFVFLTNGIVPSPIEWAFFKSKRIKSAILRAFSPRRKKGYSSAQEFYEALIPR